jgi:hypothetical protein
MMKNTIVLLVVIVLFAACKKDEDSKMSDIPELEFVSVTPSNAKEFIDSLIFAVRYKDGNGDLGENNPDVKNLFLVDNRIGITYEYRISQLAPTGSSIATEGNLNVVLQNIVITDSSTQQNATFSIYVKDRAGNVSNTVTSGTIVVTQ